MSSLELRSPTRLADDRRRDFRDRRARETARLARSTSKDDLLLPTTEERAADEARRRLRHLRAMPYPFSGMLAITSDIDRSNRDLYARYTGQLVRDNGLDFGDSVWLSSNQVGTNAGLAFYGVDLRMRHPAWERRRELDLSPCELAREYHRGNIDHWHMFLPRGPRVALARRPAMRDGEHVFSFAPERITRGGKPVFTQGIFAVRPFPVLGAVVAVPGDAAAPESLVVAWRASPRDEALSEIALEPADDRELYPLLNHRHEGRRLYLFAITPAADSAAAVPLIQDVDHVRVRLRDAGSGVPALYLVNCHSGILLDRLRHLKRAYGVSMTTASVHAMWHLVRRTTLDDINGQVLRAIEAAEPDRSGRGGDALLDALAGEAATDDVFFSTMGDHPLSFARMFPELQREHGFAYVRFSGPMYSLFNRNMYVRELGEDNGVFPDNACLVYPVAREDGGALFNIVSTKSEVPDDYEDYDDHQRSRTTAASFDARMDQLMRRFRSGRGTDATWRGCGIFFYTHLGNTAPKPAPPSPYFDPAVVGTFRDSHYGRCAAGEPRVWFTRASVLADFAMVNQALIELADVDFEGSTVDIASAPDPFTGGRTPRDAAQLYGQTFFVRDAIAATVTLDGREIHDVQRNARSPGEPSESVTVVECGIREVVFDDLDPAAHREHTLDGATWQWRTGDADCPSGAFGRLALGAGSAAGSLELRYPGLRLEGAQHLFCSLRRSSPEVRFGLEWHVESGGVFYFGDAGAGEGRTGIAARYVLDGRAAERTSWFRCCVPFFDLAWDEGTGRATLANHPVVLIRLLVAGPGGAWVDVDELELGRPRTTAPSQGAGLALVGGRAPGGHAATLESLADPAHGPAQRAAIDAFGGFRFTGVPHGPWRVRVLGERGAETVVEVRCDRFDLPQGPTA